MGSLFNPILTLSDSQFQKLADFIHKNVGIKMPAEKKIMVQSRLTSRLKTLNFTSFDEYLDYVFSPTSKGREEIALMINQITTNLTNFFRESNHFDFMTNTILPEFLQKGIQNIELWSAGCSTGQEPYTLAIVMEEYLRQNKNSFSAFSILATDISSRVLDTALNAVYPASEAESLPLELKKRYFLKSKSDSNPQVRLKPFIREKVTFKRLNFMDSSYKEMGKKHIIFCRNVLIYFDKPTQEKVVRKLTEQLLPGGYIFLGHSETIFGMDLPLKNVAPTTFQKI